MLVARLAEILEDNQCGLAQVVAETGHVCLDQIAALTERIDALQKQMRTEALQDDKARRLQTMPGIGPITAMAVTVFAPPIKTFRRGRDVAASRRMRASGTALGLVPQQHATGGRQPSKMGRRDIGSHLVIRAISVVRAAVRRSAPAGSWLARTLEKMPRMVVAIALANRMARQVWAMLVKNEDDRDPVPAA
ncbi:MAG: transposase [Pseudomonadota bacterium]